MGIIVISGSHPLKENISHLLQVGQPGNPVVELKTDFVGENGEERIGQEIEGVLKTYKNIDVLISCPANPVKEEFIRQDKNTWESIIDTCLTRMMFTCKAVLPGMMRQKFGRIINVISVKALMGESEEVVYCSALGGLVTMAKCVAKEVGRYNITMNNICYGLLNIDEREIKEGSSDYAIIKQLSLKRNCSYDDIVNTIRFLITAEAGYINGKSIILDGGVL